MKNIDWQAFQDGSMSERERSEVKRLLTTDPRVKAEWQGFQSFQLQVKSALASEAIPMDRLDSLLHQVVQRHGPSIAPGPMLGMLAAGVVMSSLLFFNRSTDVPLAPSAHSEGIPESAAQTMETSDPKLARSWVNQKSGFDAPADLSGAAVLYSVASTNRTVRYHYKVGGEEWLVKACRASDVSLPGGGINQDGNTFFVRQDGFAFMKHGLAYEISGPRREEAWKLAVLACKRCDASPPPALKSPGPGSCPK